MAPEMQRGAKLGTRIATLVSQSIVYTHTRLHNAKHKLIMAAFHSMSDEISEENHRSIGPILRQLHEDTPDDSISHGLIKFMATERGQLQAGAGLSAAAGSILGSLAQVVNNELAPAVRGLLSTNPHQLPDPGTIAELAARGLAQTGDAVSSINQQGIDSGWANALIKLNEVFPDTGTMLDLVRRGELSPDTFIEFSGRAGMSAGTAELILKTVNAPLSPADAALAVLRGNMSQGDGAKIAADNGLTAEQFQTLIDNTGEPLGLMELLEARRRGFIDDARLTRGIIQSRIRNEWVDVAKAIAFSPMSTADAVNAVVQNHLSQQAASAIASQNGLEPGAFDILVQTAGEPLSRTEMEQLYNRGLVTQDQVKQALNESRLKPKYTDLAFQLHTKLLPIRNLAEAVEFGVLPLADAVSEAMKNGYSQKDATTLIQSASARKLQTYKHGIVTAAESLYVDNGITLTDAMSVARDAGFDDAEATAIFQGAEYKRQARMFNAAVSAVRSKYIMHHLDKPTASTLLDGIGVVSDHRDELLAIWDIERSANVTMLTEAQIIKALKEGAIDLADATSRLQQRGYADANIAILLFGLTG
jgi:hypothetical protein